MKRYNPRPILRPNAEKHISQILHVGEASDTKVSLLIGTNDVVRYVVT